MAITATRGEAAASAEPVAEPATELGVVSGAPRLWLRAEGLAALAAGVGLYLHLGGQLIWLVPLLLAVDISMVGYGVGPRPGAFVYNLAHNWAAGITVLGAAWWLGSPAVALAGAILVAHTGMDRAAGYGLKYPTAFADTHLGRLGRPGR
jgi:type IV secretory pathway TrbD component